MQTVTGRTGATLVVSLACVLLIGLSVNRRWLLTLQLLAPLEDPTPVPPPEVAFFAGRNQIALTVPRTMTVEELLDTYQLRQSKDEILTALGTKSLTTLVPAGHTLTVTLTPKLVAPGGKR